MKRDIIRIDQALCNGCGDCVPSCMEGALQIIGGKARLISDLECDGLGACIKPCPVGAITLELREAPPYSEVRVIEEMCKHGRETVVAHLRHLHDHGQVTYLQEAVTYLASQQGCLPFAVEELLRIAAQASPDVKKRAAHGCPGSRSPDGSPSADTLPSALSHWPIQLHLVNPMANCFLGAELLVSADCVAHASGDFHRQYLPGKALVIACPKLDSQLGSYVEKLECLVDDAEVASITVLVMEVPCCGALLGLVRQAAASARRKIPVRYVVVDIKGRVLEEGSDLDTQVARVQQHN